MMKIIPKNFKHYVKKRAALKVEPLPLETTEERTIYAGRYHQSYSITKGNRTCVICGVQAVNVVWFQADGCQLIEKYCDKCLDKYVNKP